MKILIATPELAPFVRIGEPAEAIEAITYAFADFGHDIRLVMPRYGSIAERFPERLAPFPVPVGEDETARVLEAQLKGRIPVYLIDHPRFFGERQAVYGEPDDAQRFAFFARAVMEMLGRLAWRPDVIHGNDWSTGLLPLYFKQLAAADPAWNDTACVFTFHNLTHQGLFGPDLLEYARIDRHQHFHLEGLEYYGQVNYLKSGVVYADLVSTVSKRYAEEVQLPEFGEGLSGFLFAKRDKLQGINSAIDTRRFDPAADKALAANYTARDLRGKLRCKMLLQRQLGLTIHTDIPVIATMVNRVGRRELDLVLACREKLRRLETQLIIWGSEGHGPDDDLLKDLGADTRVLIDRDPATIRRLYAGADLALYPAYLARFPVGVMVGLRYGAVPVVYTSKDHFDVIVNHEGPSHVGNTFTFNEYSATSLYKAISRAVEAYRQVVLWNEIVARGMNLDLSWAGAARQYEEFYREALHLRRQAQPVITSS